MSAFRKQGASGFVLLLVLAVIICSSSCVSVKKYVYFKDLPDSFPHKTLVLDQVTPFEDLKIESGDILQVTFQQLLKDVVMPVQTGPNTSGAPSGTQAGLYQVDKDGNIEYSLIGKIKVTGLTTSEARDVIKKESLRYYNEPIVNVRITNFNVQVLGDVTRAGTIVSPSERFSIIDAITNAGDLSYSARRDNILLIRSQGDQKVCARYDISNTQIFKSPYYYLKQNDIIYVEPNKYKIQSSDQTAIRNLGILSSLISLASILLAYRSLK